MAASHPTGKRGRKFWLIVAGWVVVVAALLFSLLPEDDPAPAVSPAGVVTVGLTVDQVTDLMRVIRAGEEVARSAEELARRDDADAIRSARFVVSILGKDRYGNEELRPFMTLTYPMAVLRKVNYSKMESWEMLDLASAVTVEGGYSHRAVAAFCAEMSARAFCSKAAA